MRMAIIYFSGDGTVFSMASPMAVPTGAAGAYVQADFDLCVKNSWPDGAASAVSYQNATTAQAYAAKPQ